MVVAIVAGLQTAGCQGPAPFIRGPGLITCTVNRQECATYDTTSKMCTSVGSAKHFFLGDVCYDPAADRRTPDAICLARFCTPGPDAPGTCTATGALVNNPTGPLCQPFTGSIALATVSWRVHGESCINPGQPICQLILRDESHSECEPLVSTLPGLETAKAPPQNWLASAVHVDPVDVNKGCTGPQALQRFQFGPGPLGTASGGGTNVNLSAVRGLTTFDQSCGSDGCFPANMLGFDADLADTTVAGTSLTNLSVSLTQAAPLSVLIDGTGNQFTGFAADALQLRVVGRKAGVDSYYSIRNSAPWHFDSSATGFHLTGAFSAIDVASNGSPLPVTVNVDVSGTPATTQTVACAGATGISRLFGFEDNYGWTATSSNGALALVTSPITQGCAAQALRGQGFMTIDSAPFTTRGLVTNAASSVDLFIPPNQPNQFWTGQVQLFLSCPSGNFFHQFIGQAEITGRPTNRFSTMRIPLTSAARAVLGQTHDDCSFQLALNVNTTGQAWVFDNFRFTP